MKTTLSSLPTETVHNNSVFKKALIKQNDKNGKVGTWNYAWLDPGMQFDTHTHADGVEYYLFLHGQGEMLVGTEWFSVAADDYVTVPLGHEHTVKNTSKEKLVFITLRTVEL